MANKGALSLLTCYGGDGESSDEDVPGPRVSTKRVHKDGEDEPNSKRSERLPVPSCLTSNSHEEVHIDDPSLHDGRIRSFKHVRGNWATLIYIPFDIHDGMESLVSTVINSQVEVELKKIDTFHISLSKTVVLKYHWIQSFIQSLKQDICGFRRFMAIFEGFEVYCNEERTRTFIGIQIKSGFDTCSKLVQTIDKCLTEYKLPTFYKDHSFHMSIVWCVGDFEDELKLSLPELNHIFQDHKNNYQEDNWHLYVEYLICKTGNKYFQLYLT